MEFILLTQALWIILYMDHGLKTVELLLLEIV